jgi:hypothetical protein
LHYFWINLVVHLFQKLFILAFNGFCISWFHNHSLKVP